MGARRPSSKHLPTNQPALGGGSSMWGAPACGCGGQHWGAPDTRVLSTVQVHLQRRCLHRAERGWDGRLGKQVAREGLETWGLAYHNDPESGGPNRSRVLPKTKAQALRREAGGNRECAYGARGEPRVWKRHGSRIGGPMGGSGLAGDRARDECMNSAWGLRPSGLVLVWGGGLALGRCTANTRGTHPKPPVGYRQHRGGSLG